MLRAALGCLLALWTAVAAAQTQPVLQSGNITPGHAAIWSVPGIIQDGGFASDGALTSLGVTNNGGPGICINSSTPATVNFNQLCFSVGLSTGAIFSLANNGSASGGLSFNINGTAYNFPFTIGGIVGPVSSTVGHFATWNNTTGNLVADFDLFGTANQFTALQTFSGGANAGTINTTLLTVNSTANINTITAGSIFYTALAGGAISSNSTIAGANLTAAGVAGNQITAISTGMTNVFVSTGGAATNGINLQGSTFTGFAFVSPNFSVSGGGDLVAHTVQPSVFTVATLPSCNLGSTGQLAVVNDSASVPSYDTPVGAGGGSNVALLFCRNSTWTFH